MRKRTTKKTTAKTPDSKSTSIEMTSRGEREGGGGRRSGETEEKRRFSRDLIDGPVHSVGTMQPFNTVTTVSSPSGFRLAQHMTIAGSFLDFALFVADVEHLKFILDAGKDKINYYTLLVVLIIGSLTLQVNPLFTVYISTLTETFFLFCSAYCRFSPFYCRLQEAPEDDCDDSKL